MNRLVDYNVYPGKYSTLQLPPPLPSPDMSSDILVRERNEIFNSVRIMQERLTQIEHDLGLFEQRVCGRS